MCSSMQFQSLDHFGQKMLSGLHAAELKDDNVVAQILSHKRSRANPD